MIDLRFKRKGFFDSEKYSFTLQNFPDTSNCNEIIRTVISSDTLISIVADGDELDFILEHFSNLRRITFKMPTTWVGEDAIFIVLNLFKMNRLGVFDNG